MNKSELLLTLKTLNISPKKARGQNFLIDKNILDKIIAFSQPSAEDIVLEVGPGLGFLTKALIENVKKIIVIEVDRLFSSYLEDHFQEYSNIEIINDDILKIDLPYHNKVVSNLPFSATGPILEKLFFKENPPEGTLIIEKKLSERIMNKGDYKTFSRITVGVNSFMKPIKSFPISKNCFYPVPKIESSLIKLEPKKKINSFLISDGERVFFLKFIAGIMPYKNKNIVNAIQLFIKKMSSYIPDREKILEILNGIKLENQKVFTFTIEDLILIAQSLFNESILG